MIDILLLAGTALCVLSVLLAILALIATRAPRGAAITLVLGLALVFASNLLDDRPLGLNSLAQSWSRLVNGESLGTATPVPAEAPAAADTPAPVEAAPATAPTPEPAAPAATPVEPAPASEAPAPAAPAAN